MVKLGLYLETQIRFWGVHSGSTRSRRADNGSERAFLILTDETAVAGHVCGEDSGESALNAFLGHGDQFLFQKHAVGEILYVGGG